MRSFFSGLTAAGILLLGMSNGFADTPAVPTTAPMCDVYLTPFTPLGNDNSLDWVGRAVEQNLMTDLARAKLHPQGAEKSVANSADAQTAAKSAGAKFLISGTFQVADQQVRFTGQVIDTATGNVVGGISTTGAIRDLFKMEDELSTQAVDELTKQSGVANGGNPPNNKPAPVRQPAAPAQAPAGPVAPAQPPVIVQIVQPGANAVPVARYQGSALEQYVNSNRVPSSDYKDQDTNRGENFASTPGNNYNVEFGTAFGLGFVNYGYGLGYPLPPYGKYGYGTDGHLRRRAGDPGDH